jgi:hypothetical protein
MRYSRLLLPTLLSASVFSLLFVKYFTFIRAYSQDLGRHLLVGKIILETFGVPTTNLFSYTHPTFPFQNHHFLSEVIFFIVHSFFGNNGLQVLAVCVIFAAFGMVFFYAARKYSFWAASFLSFFYLGVLFERTDIRPELFSFFFLALFVVILFQHREKSTRLLYILPFLSFLWVNVHIYFFVGIVVLILFVVDAFFQKKENFKLLFGILLLSCVATLGNPHFLDGALYPLRVFQNYGYTIEENQSLFLLESLGFEKTSATYLKITSFFLFVTLLAGFRKVRVIDWLLAITFTYAAFVAVRNFPLFVFATFIPFARILFLLTHTSLQAFAKRYRLLPAAFAACLVLFVGWQTLRVTQTSPVGFGVALGAERGVDFFEANKLRGPIFNNFDIGSYLLYRLYPDEYVFIDGRPEAYPASFLQNTYIAMQEKPEIFSDVDKQYGFQSIFFTHTDMTPWAQAFLKHIVTDPTWQVVYLDDTSIILVKKNAQTEKLRTRHGMVYPDFRQSPSTGNDMQSLFKLANFYQLVGAEGNLLKTYQLILHQSPTFCPALYGMASILTQKSDPAAPVFVQRYQTHCQQVLLGQ